MISRFVLAASLAAVAAALPSQAAPVERMRTADAALVVPAAGGDRLYLSLRFADAPGGGLLTVHSLRCDDERCTGGDVYEGRVSELSLPSGSATGRAVATVGGRVLRVSWTPEPAHAAGSVVVYGTDDATTASTYAGESARTHVTLGEQECRGRGGVGEGVRVSGGGGASARPLSALRLPDAVTGC